MMNNREDVTMGNQQASINALTPIPENPGYFTDGIGNVFSFVRGNKQKLLKASEHYGKSKNPYLRIKVKDRLWLQHRFIASVLVGRALASDEVVNHKNGVTTDNSLENLEVLAQRENVKHAVDNKLYCHGDAWYEARGLSKNEASTTSLRA